MNWNTDCEPSLITQHQYQPSLLLVAEWKQDPAAMFQHLLESIPRRVDTVIAVKGGPTPDINGHDIGMSCTTSRCPHTFGHAVYFNLSICDTNNWLPKRMLSSWILLRAFDMFVCMCLYQCLLLGLLIYEKQVRSPPYDSSWHHVSLYTVVSMPRPPLWCVILYSSCCCLIPTCELYYIVLYHISALSGHLAYCLTPLICERELGWLLSNRG